MEYIEPGTSITIHGLNARPDLNGLDGIVLNYIPSRERYHVKVLSGVVVLDGEEERKKEEEIFLRPGNCSKKKKETTTTSEEEEERRKRKAENDGASGRAVDIGEPSSKVAKVAEDREEKEEEEEKAAIARENATTTTTTGVTREGKKGVVEKIEELKDDETLLKEFFKDVSQTDRASEVERILSCFKLNPYEYLNVRFDATIQEVAKAFRKVSLLVHPDKCNHPKASIAFDAIGQAQKLLTTIDFKKEIDFNLDQAKKKVVGEYKKGRTEVHSRFRVEKTKDDVEIKGRREESGERGKN